MATSDRLARLAGEIRENLCVLERASAYYDSYTKAHGTDDRTTENAIILSDIVVSFYTCIETIFLRISQFFENSLEPSRWHRDLLQVMTLSIKGVRERVISEETHMALSELLAFRHFKRYYFRFEYDWDRLDLVRKKFLDVRSRVIKELHSYLEYLDALAAKAASTGQ